MAFDLAALNGLDFPNGTTALVSLVVPLSYGAIAYMLGVKHMNASIQIARLLSIGYGLIFVSSFCIEVTCRQQQHTSCCMMRIDSRYHSRV